MNIRIASRLRLRFAAPWSCSPPAANKNRCGEIDWAKAALARNPALEIVATDEASGTFSVRDTTTGAMYKLQTQELMAASAAVEAGAEPAAATPAPAPAASARRRPAPRRPAPAKLLQAEAEPNYR